MNQRRLKIDILKNQNAHFISLCETHLRADDKIDIGTDYICLCNNRQLQNRQARRHSGGVALLVHESIINEYNVTVVDKARDGILAVKVEHKKSEYDFLLVSCYLPPEKSAWGQDATGFFAHLLSIIYSHCDVDGVYIMGDFNSRIGSWQDFNENIDADIGQRKITDKTTNKHGETFLEFLKDSKCCVLNGRFDSRSENYTFVQSQRGSSVVDWVITPHDNLNTIKTFHVHLCKDLLNELNSERGQHSDHSLLAFEFMPTFLPECVNDDINDVNIRDSEPQNIKYFKRYNVSKLPDNFMQSDITRQALIRCIDMIEWNRAVQVDVDNVYEHFCNIYYNEMNKHLKCKGSKRASCGKKKMYKPYWNENLQQAWDHLCASEKSYLRATQHSRQRRRLHDALKDAQSQFDKMYKKAKRKYHREKQISIEGMCTRDPKTFWREIKELGPRKNTDIPMRVYDSDGTVTCDKLKVLSKWKNDFECLAKKYDNNEHEFDTAFYEYVNNMLPVLEENDNCNFVDLNRNITKEEVLKAVNKTKTNKAVGWEGLPYEVLKNEITVEVLQLLFDKIFQSNIVPVIWKHGVIKPIPKSALLDPIVPMNYRGIALLSTVYKVFSSILNNRLLQCLEKENLYADEQNGFRPQRCCTDHIYCLTSTIRHVIQNGQSVYACFIDAEKAFDKIDRVLLLYKLLVLGINGKIYKNIKEIYTNCVNCVNVNNNLSDWFPVDCGVRQGDTLSPTLFGIFVNDLVHEVKQLGLGIPIGDEKLSILVYADDIVVLGMSEIELQSILNVISKWGSKFRIRFSPKKTNVIHFRKQRTRKTCFNFFLGPQNIKLVDNYKYLGVLVNEFMDFKIMASSLADAGGRALGAIVNKFHKLKGLGYYTFTKMYTTGVCPILDYASEIWGLQRYDKIDTIQNRALRTYLGVHNFAPNIGLNGDCGWTASIVRRKTNAVRFWNRLQKMPTERLTKRVFIWDKCQITMGWASDMRILFNEIGLTDVYDNNQGVAVHNVWSLLHEKFCLNWSQELSKYPKLRTYILFKNTYSVEPYVIKILSRKRRSIMSKLRLGILPLEIETGRWQSLAVEERVCKLCNESKVEDEFHFVFECTFYDDYRNVFIDFVSTLYNNFNNETTNEKWKILFSENIVNHTGQYLEQIYNARQSHIYCSNII